MSGVAIFIEASVKGYAVVYAVSEMRGLCQGRLTCKCMKFRIEYVELIPNMLELFEDARMLLLE